jgi:hypothetical protein
LNSSRKKHRYYHHANLFLCFEVPLIISYKPSSISHTLHPFVLWQESLTTANTSCISFVCDGRIWVSCSMWFLFWIMIGCYKTYQFS